MIAAAVFVVIFLPDRVLIIALLWLGPETRARSLE